MSHPDDDADRLEDEIDALARASAEFFSANHLWDIRSEDITATTRNRKPPTRVRTTVGTLLVAAAIIVVFVAPLPQLHVFGGAHETTTTTSPTVAATGPGSSDLLLAGVDGAAAWALSATQLTVSDNGGLDWSDVALPLGVTPKAVTAIAKVPSGESWLATLKGSHTVDLYRKGSSASWSETTLVPDWSTATAGYPFQVGSVTITPGPGDMVTVVLLDELGNTTAIPRLFVSSDKGATFRQYHPPLTSAMNIYWTSVTFVTPTSGVIVGSYGAGGSEAIFYTSDGGRSFSPTKVVGVPKKSPTVFGTPFEAGANIELPVVETTSSGGARFSLFVSHNGGASFSGPVGKVINVSGSFALGQSPLVAYGQTLWVVGERTIYESANDGRTWTTVSASDLSAITAMSLTSATSAIAVAGSSQCAQFKADCTSKRYFVRTTNAGKTWTVLSSPSLPPQGFIAAQLFTPTNKVVYVLGSPPGGRVELLRSDNGGATFGQETMPPASRLETDRQQGNFTVQFEGAERGVAVVGSSVFLTSDGGGSWRRVPGPIGGPWVDFWKGNTVRIETAGSVAYAIVIHCVNGEDCPSYRLYRSTNWFSSWVKEPAPDSGKSNAAGGIDLSAFGSDVWILLGNGVSPLMIFGSTNEGRSFDKLVAPSAVFCGTTPFSARVLWISCSTGMQVAFFRSTDGGAHLTRLQLTGFGTGGAELWPVSASTAFFRADTTSTSPGLFRTTNGGRSFVRLRRLPEAFGAVAQKVAAMSFGSDLDGYALLGQGLVFRTSDGGSSWTPVQL